MVKVRELNIVSDPYFFEYTEEHEYEKMNVAELYFCLKIVRASQREISEKFYREKEDVLKNKLEDCNQAREIIEQIIFDKQGFIPKQITENILNDFLRQNKNTIYRENKKKK